MVAPTHSFSGEELLRPPASFGELGENVRCGCHGGLGPFFGSDHPLPPSSGDAARGDVEPRECMRMDARSMWCDDMREPRSVDEGREDPPRRGIREVSASADTGLSARWRADAPMMRRTVMENLEVETMACIVVPSARMHFIAWRQWRVLWYLSKDAFHRKERNLGNALEAERE